MIFVRGDQNLTEDASKKVEQGCVDGIKGCFDLCHNSTPGLVGVKCEENKDCLCFVSDIFVSFSSFYAFSMVFRTI